MSLPYKTNLIPFAKELRKNMTRHEKHLWYDFLSTYPVRFQRQKTIGRYIVDFYCHSAKLVIELDGSQHFEENAVEYDRSRTDFLNSQNVEVLRFTNLDIDKHFKEVCMAIDQKIREKVTHNDKL